MNRLGTDVCALGLIWSGPVLTLTVAVVVIDLIRPSTPSDSAQWIGQLLIDDEELAVLVTVVGAAILKGSGTSLVYPRWTNRYSPWTGVLVMSSVLVLLIKDDPFAWNGVIALGIPIPLFVILIVAVTVTTLRAITEKRDTGSSSHPSSVYSQHASATGPRAL